MCNLLNIYYIVIIAWALFYFGLSFQAVLPWTTCGNWWNTDACVSFDSGMNHTALEILKAANITPVDSVVEFWDRRVLQITSGVHDMGGMVWPLFGCLFTCWVLTYFAIWKGVKVTGKIMCFTATFPYVMLTALFIRGITLPGAMIGIRYYLEPNWDKIWSYQVWNDAGTQIFYSYALGIGGMIALGSYNKFNNNFAQQAAILCACNSLSSLFAGFGIFSVLGYMSFQLEIPMEDVAEAGPGLVFIAYPKAMAQMPFASLWSALFFCMILLVGLDTQFVQVESVVTAIVDLYPDKLRQGNGRYYVVALVCIVDFSIGCCMVTQGGMFVFHLFDCFSASGIILLTICGLEATVLSWVYGSERLADNMEMMLGFRLPSIFKYAWKFVTPLMTAVMIVCGVAFYKSLVYNNWYEYPSWALSFGWMLTASSLVWIPGYCLYKFFSYPGNFKEKWDASTKPELKPHHLRPQDWDDSPSIIYKKTSTLDPLTNGDDSNCSV